MSATVNHGAALEELGHANWYLAQAFQEIVKPCHAGIYVEGAEPEVLMDALLATIKETENLMSRFTAAQGAHP